MLVATQLPAAAAVAAGPRRVCISRSVFRLVHCPMERVAGIEPARSAWEADRLPLHHTRAWLHYHRRASARNLLKKRPANFGFDSKDAWSRLRRTK